MKKMAVLLISTTIIAVPALAQNVGIGVTVPTQKLDVAGNVNLSGNLMVNGVAGTDGQVLGMNGNSMQWMDKSRFKNWALYNTSSVFSVPAGTKEVMIEMWGAGGGGHNPGGGGGSGGYFIGLIPVTGILNINIAVGIGGTGASAGNSGGPGGVSSFSCTGFNVFTGGGFGADSISANNGNTSMNMGGFGGLGFFSNSTIPSNFTNFFFIKGNSGSPTQSSYVQVTGSVFGEQTFGGIGGVAPLSGQKPSPSSSELKFGSTINRSIYVSAAQADFGSGGSCNIINAGSGGNGRVVVYY
ncbi:MAG: hypothetical protein V4722_26245 [Bacteroidota bacterium]